mgnify:FL=1
MPPANGSRDEGFLGAVLTLLLEIGVYKEFYMPGKGHIPNHSKMIFTVEKAVDWAWTHRAANM